MTTAATICHALPPGSQQQRESRTAIVLLLQKRKLKLREGCLPKGTELGAVNLAVWLQTSKKHAEGGWAEGLPVPVVISLGLSKVD